MVLREREREKWELENFPEGEIQEMIELYTERDLTEEKAQVVVNAMSTNKEFFIDQMVTDELGMELPDINDNVWIDGMITFCFFIFFGIFPLLAYICLNTADIEQDIMFIISCCLTAVMLFVPRVVKSKFTTQKWYLAGLEIQGLGSFTAGISYGIGKIVSEIV